MVSGREAGGEVRAGASGDGQGLLEALERKVGIHRHLPPIGDVVLKSSPDDFVVEEVTVEGSVNAIDGFLGAGGVEAGGDYVEVTLVKRGLTTRDAVARVAREFCIPPTAISYAGLKDAAAVTAQSVRFPRRAFPGPVSLPGVALLEPRPATRPLRIGELWGNRFRIRLQTQCSLRSEGVEAFTGTLSTVGVPNYFDFQRFGRRLNLHEIGRRLALGDAEGACRLFVTEPSIAEPLRLRRLRKWAAEAWPDASAIEGRFRGWGRVVEQESQLLGAIRRRGFEAIWKLPFLSSFSMKAWTSYQFNRVVSVPPLRTDAIPLVDGTSEVEGAGTICSRARRLLRPASRPAVVKGTEVTFSLSDHVLELAFMLPKGSYATAVVRSGFRLHCRNLARVTLPVGSGQPQNQV